MEQEDVESVVIRGQQERLRYSQAVLALLRRVNVQDGDATLKNELKPVYELLTLLQGTSRSKHSK